MLFIILTFSLWLFVLSRCKSIFNAWNSAHYPSELATIVAWNSAQYPSELATIVAWKSAQYPFQLQSLSRNPWMWRFENDEHVATNYRRVNSPSQLATDSDSQQQICRMSSVRIGCRSRLLLYTLQSASVASFSGWAEQGLHAYSQLHPSLSAALIGWKGSFIQESSLLLRRNR